jgi:hypothetical protein
MSRAWVLTMLLACGGPKRTAEPTPVNPAATPDPVLSNQEPAPEPAMSVDAAACENACIDICCKADEICSHGRAGDGTYAKCLRNHTP